MDRQWRDRAACRPGSGVDPELFFPPGDPTVSDRCQSAKAKALIASAKEVCARCPVVAECLGDALRHDRPDYAYGVRGGLSAEQRRETVRERRLAARHGAA